MLSVIIIPLVGAAALGYARLSGKGELIVRRPYANRYNDAAGAREDHLG